MAEPTSRARVSGWLLLAVAAAFVAALAAGAALVWANGERDDAERHRAGVEAVLVVRRGEGSPDRLAGTRAAITGVRAQLGELSPESKHAADLVQQDAALVQAALDAGAKGDVAAFNEAVTKRNQLAPQVDAAVEQLRSDVNAVLVALATVTNRTAP